MYIIKKGSIEDEKFNIVCHPVTQEPLMFDDMLEAEEFAEQAGFTGPDVEVVDVNPEKLQEA